MRQVVFIERAEAKQQGLKRYFNGNPCKHGHVFERLTVNGQCYRCVRIKQEALFARLREERAARKQTREEKLRKKREWAKLDYMRRGHEIKSAVAEWKRKNPGLVAAANAQRDAAQVRAAVAWRDDAKIKSLYEIAAAYTASGIPCHVDHVVPVANRFVCGLHVEHNLQLLHKTDNLRKGNSFNPETFT